MASFRQVSIGPPGVRERRPSWTAETCRTRRPAAFSRAGGEARLRGGGSMDLSGVRKGGVEIDAGFDLVHADCLRFFPQLAAELGGDAEALAREAGVDPRIFDARRTSLGYRAMAGLLE